MDVVSSSVWSWQADAEKKYWMQKSGTICWMLADQGNKIYCMISYKVITKASTEQVGGSISVLLSINSFSQSSIFFSFRLKRLYYISLLNVLNVNFGAIFDISNLLKVCFKLYKILNSPPANIRRLINLNFKLDLLSKLKALS